MGMILKRMAGAVAALLLAMSVSGPAFAATSDSTNVSLTITPGTQFSVDITNSNNFPNQPFSLGNPGNFTYSAFFNLEVVDLRGTGAGWNVNASATPFTPAVPTGTLPLYSNGLYWLPCAAVTGFCAGPGSISNGVSAYLSSYGNIINTPSLLISATPGTAPGPQPNGTGTFSTQDVVYYNNFPNALAVGTYTTTITLTLTSATP
jgi:hypothetical protein